jgi:hypothetical protein
MWKIGLDTTRNTLKPTTQYGVRHATQPLRRCYRTDILLAWFRQLNISFYTDTMFFKNKSLQGSTATQVFCNESIVQVNTIQSPYWAGTAGFFG